MTTIFDDPISWSRFAVGTWARFAFMAVMLIALQLFVVYAASSVSWRGAIALATFLAFFQLLFMYALRRLLPPQAR